MSQVAIATSLWLAIGTINSLISYIWLLISQYVPHGDKISIKYLHKSPIMLKYKITKQTHLREGSDIYNVLAYHAWLISSGLNSFFWPKGMCFKNGCKAKQTSNELVLDFKKKKKAIRFELNIC